MWDFLGLLNPLNGARFWTDRGGGSAMQRKPYTSPAATPTAKNLTGDGQKAGIPFGSTYDPATGLYTRSGSAKGARDVGLTDTIGAPPSLDPNAMTNAALFAGSRQRKKAARNSVLIDGQPADGRGINPLAVLNRRMLGGF